jgi:peptide deformylase
MARERTQLTEDDARTWPREQSADSEDIGDAAARAGAAVPSGVEEAVDLEAEPVKPRLEELDPETRERRDKALRQVRKLGDPVLRATALPVERFDETLKATIERMGELMRDSLGIGLAASQIGVLQRVFVYRVDPDDAVTAVVNPVLEEASAELEAAEEGCLSLPGVHLDVERPASVRLRGQNGEGDALVIEASGLQARVIQHELDHLNGTLILDRVSREQRREAMRALREGPQESLAPNSA